VRAAKREVTLGHFSNQVFPEGEKDRARADEMNAQRGARPSLSSQAS
jgi:hypothetical protein